MTTTTVNTKQLTKEIEWAARFVERKTTIPILSNVLLNKRGDRLTITGTDLETGGIAILDIEGDGPNFELTVPVHQMLKYLKKVDDDRVTLLPKLVFSQPHPVPDGCEGPEGEPVLSSVELTLTHGDSRLTLAGMAAESYPELPAFPLATTRVWGFTEAVPKAIIAISPPKLTVVPVSVVKPKRETKAPRPVKLDPMAALAAWSNRVA